MSRLDRIPADRRFDLDADTANAMLAGKLVLVGMVLPQRPNVRLFAMLLEHRFYKPLTRARTQFDVVMVEWAEMAWQCVGIPPEHRPLAQFVANEVSLRIANGVPTLLTATKAGVGPPEFFPINGPHVWTLETDWKTCGFTQADREVKAAVTRENARIKAIEQIIDEGGTP